MSEGFFRYCTMDNPVFTSGLIWISAVFFFGSITLYFKYQEVTSTATKNKQTLNEINTEVNYLAKDAAKTTKTVTADVKKHIEIPKAPTVTQEESGKKAKKTKS